MAQFCHTTTKNRYCVAPLFGQCQSFSKIISSENKNQRDHGGATTQPRRPNLSYSYPHHGVAFTRCLLSCIVSVVFFSFAFVLRSFSNLVFWLMVAFRFRMQLRPRPRCELPLGGISRRGSASVVPFLYAVRRRRPTHFIFDWGGEGFRRSRERRISKCCWFAGKCRGRGS